MIPIDIDGNLSMKENQKKTAIELLTVRNVLKCIYNGMQTQEITLTSK